MDKKLRTGVYSIADVSSTTTFALTFLVAAFFTVFLVVFAAGFLTAGDRKSVV
jgi:hypothetical protein